MLYMATARCGARLLPLEHAEVRQDSAESLKKYPSAILLHDDEITFEAAPVASRIVNLSSLIATRCHHTPPVGEDATLVSLIDAGAGNETTAQELYRQAVAMGDATQREFHVNAALFDGEVFAPAVLSVLIAGGTIIFR